MYLMPRQWLGVPMAPKVEHAGGAYRTAVSVKLNPEALAVLDRLRGETSRSAYLRGLLKAEVNRKLVR